jgi:hypothetical protein
MDGGYLKGVGEREIIGEEDTISLSGLVIGDHLE